MATVLLSFFLVTQFLVGFVQCIADGFRAPIKSFPFAVHGTVWSEGETRFGGIIIDENKILTAAEVCYANMRNHYVMVGIADLKRKKDPKKYKVKETVINDYVCMMLLDSHIYFGETVQRAILPEDNQNVPRLKELLYVAGYGPTIAANFSDELHYVPAYYIGSHSIHNGLSLLAKDKGNKGKFFMDYSEIGSPVVELNKRMVVGILSWKDFSTHPKHQPFVPLRDHRKWIDTHRRSFNKVGLG